jgi:hypothetical protein
MRTLACLAIVCALARVAAANDIEVSDATSLGTAIMNAQPGDVIIVDDGTYDSTGYSCDANGTAAMPITVKAKNPLMATIRFDALEGFKIGGDYWHFEGLVTQGVCANDDDCEHSYHINGAVGFSLKGSRAIDFNAQVKVNAVAPKLPNGGLIEGNELYDTRARNTANPVTKLDLDSGDDWVVRANVIHDYEKGLGDNTSYAAFMKCGGNRGLMERNLVLCSRDTTGGTRLGLSLGGGGCDPQYCQPAFDPGTPCVEHHDGIVRNNVIVNCSDVGVYINQSPNSHVLYNTLVATSGIDFRFAMTTGEAVGNLLAGMIRNRDGATGTFTGNIQNVMSTDFTSWYTDPMNGDLSKKGDLSSILGMGPANANVTDDYCARTRPSPFDVGAIQSSLGDCPTTPVSTDDAGVPVGLADGAPQGEIGDVVSADGGTSGGGGSGCSCEIGSRDRAAILPACLALVLLSLARRRGRRPLAPTRRR